MLSSLYSFMQDTVDIGFAPILFWKWERNESMNPDKIWTNLLGLNVKNDSISRTMCNRESAQAVQNVCSTQAVEDVCSTQAVKNVRSNAAERPERACKLRIISWYLPLFHISRSLQFHDNNDCTNKVHKNGYNWAMGRIGVSSEFVKRFGKDSDSF